MSIWPAVKQQHKKAADLLRKAYSDPAYFPEYQKIESSLELAPISATHEAMSDRYHYHLKMACVHIKEHKFLPRVRHLDSLSSEPFLPIDIYLDGLRSAHNIGSIIRTTEAFRLGEIHFSAKTPFATHTKVKSAAMGSDDLVTCHENSSLDRLRRPLIALETTENAISLYDFTFPHAFSLLFGNEEYGLSQEALEAADHIVQIPLLGSKNSLNVASAFAILASTIRSHR